MFTKDLLKGKRILVTGGGTGLGKAMVSKFMELGGEAIICGRRVEVLEETASELRNATGGKIETFQCDVRNPDSIEKMLDAIWATRPLDGLVNNAAGNFVAKFEDLSHRAVDSVLGIVLHGTAYVTLGCGKRWLAQETKKQPAGPMGVVPATMRASVLNIVTTYAWTGSSFVVPSAMAKAGVLAMTRSLAVEWGGRGIRMNAIAPGPFPTPGAWDRLIPNEDIARKTIEKVPLRRVGEHSELANLSAYLMSDYASFINGDCITIDGGEWLKGAGEFNFLEALRDEDWRAMREKLTGKKA